MPPTHTGPHARTGARDVFSDDLQRTAAGSFGLVILLVILGRLFGGLVIGAIALRLDGDSWPADLPHLPWQTWASSVALLGTSAALLACTAAQRRESNAGVRNCLAAAFVLAVVFTGMQGWAWYAWHEQSATIMDVFTGVHVAHVLGGLVPLALLGWYAVLRAWTPARRGFLRHTAVYWHFLDVVWLVLLVTLVIIL